MRRIGIGRRPPNKRHRPTEPFTGSQAAGSSDNGNSIDDESLPSQDVLHSTAVGTPAKRIAFSNPLDSDDDGNPISPLQEVRDQGEPTGLNPEARPEESGLENEVVNNRQHRESSQHPAIANAPVPGPSQQQRSPEPEVDRNSPIIISAPSGCPDLSTVLQLCGFMLSSPPGRNHMLVEQLCFRRKLTKWVEEKLRGDPQGTTNPGTKFIWSMRTYLSDKVNFRQSMTPTQFTGNILQGSLLQNLLCVLPLQPHVLKVTFPVLAEAVYSAGNQETIDTVVTILCQLKWLPKIIEPENFTSTIVDLAMTAVPLAQKELINCLPEIIPEEKHPFVLKSLKKLLEKSIPGLVPSIIDCFSTLDVPSEDWENIRETALTHMFNSPLGDYPAFFGFLFRTEDIFTLEQAITSLREKLELTPLGEDPKTDVYMIEIVEKVRFCSAVNSKLVPIWVKSVKDDLESNNFDDVKPLDLVMLLIFCENYKSPILPLKLIFSNEKHSLKLLDNVLKNNLTILNQVFPILIKICENCLRSKEKKAHASMENVLVKLFLNFSIIESQEIVMALTNVFLEGNPDSREASLRIITEIAKENPKKLLLFAPYLMSLLEYIMKFSANELKLLMNVLAMLSHIEGNRDSEIFATEFSILLRKQLNHTNNLLRSYGVMGSLAAVKQMSQQSASKDTCEERINEVLRLVWGIVELKEDACLIFFDELSEIASLLPNNIAKTFQEDITRKFQKCWTTKDLNGSKSTGDITLSESFDANKEVDGGSFELYISFEEKPVGMSPLVVPSHLRLISRLVSANEQGDLTAIDAILGSPVILPDMDIYYKQTKKIANCTFEQRKKLGRYLLLGINFFRESVSAFVDQRDPELRIKVWLRLSNIVYLQQLLVQNFINFPLIPLAYMSESGGPTSRPTTEATKKKIAAGKKSSKADNKENDKKATKKKTNPKKKKENEGEPKVIELEEIIQPKYTIPYLRRFEAKVFNILLRAPLSDDIPVEFSKIAEHIGSSPTQQLQAAAKLTPESLGILLVEMNQQAKYSKRVFNVREIKQIVGSLCTHVESIVQLYKDKDLSVQDEARFESCFRLVLRTFSLVLESTHNCSDELQEELIHKFLATVAKRLTKDKAKKERRFPDILKDVAVYFSKLSKSVKQSATAVEHLAFLRRLGDLTKEHKVVSPVIESLAKAYLEVDWKLNPSQVDIILKSWFAHTEDPLAIMTKIVNSIIPNDGDDIAEEVPSRENFGACTTANFHAWYSNIFSTLANTVQKCGKKLKTTEEIQQFWTRSLLVMKPLVLVILKCQSVRKNAFLVPLLKYSRQFFEVLSNYGVKKLPKMMSKDSQQAKAYIKNVQTLTRKVQVICEDSKVRKDIQLLRFVPLLRKALEILVFRFREILAMCGVASAFVMGFLRHKDMDGSLMNSQPYNDDEVCNDPTDDEMDVDDDDGDINSNPFERSDSEENSSTYGNSELIDVIPSSDEDD